LIYSRTKSITQIFEVL